MFGEHCPTCHNSEVVQISMSVEPLQLTVIHDPLVLADANLVLIQPGRNVLVLLVEDGIPVARLPPAKRHLRENPWWIRYAGGDVDRCDDAGSGIGDIGDSRGLFGRRFGRLRGGSHSVGVTQLCGRR